ncbi:g1384 [Coccomyxa viridis]|uniref:DNA-directed RNA polymerase III subunit RPC6 n=1 Tax=Coccomyxa viridis TaxID=1274662 RepID=A0ABP1FHW1_9CHLO
MATKASAVEQVILQLCGESTEWLAFGEFQAALPDISGESISNAINGLLAKHRLNVQRQKDGELSFKFIPEGEALKLKGLSPEDVLIYQHIAKAGNLGIWTKDLKLRTNLQNPQVTRILKTLEGRGLVKNVKSVQHANRKVYMLAELEPASEITGGAWYTNQEFDAAFIDVLREFCHKYIQEMGEVTLADMVKALQKQRVSKLELGPGDVQSILRTLLYDGYIESMDRDGEDVYRPCKDCAPDTTAFTAIPCGVCPVSQECTEGGPISPSTCLYYQAYLEF